MTFRIFQTCLWLTVFLTPLIYATPSLGFEQNKVYFFLIGILVSTIMWLFSMSRDLSFRKFQLTQIKKASILFLSILFITSILGVDFYDSLVGESPYFQGWIIYAGLFLLSFLISFSKLQTKHFGWAILGAAWIVSLISIWEWISLHLLGVQVFTYAGRVVSTFGQPNFYSGFILLSLPFLYADQFKNKLKEEIFVTVSMIVFALAIVASQSRIAIFLMFIFMIYFLFRKLKLGKKFIYMILVIVFVIGIFASFLFKSGIFWNELQPFFSKDLERKEVSVEKRVFIWPAIGQKIWERPILGYGLENLNEAFALYKPPVLDPGILLSVKDLEVDRSHNLILDLLIFSGILGLLSFGLILVLLFKNSRSWILYECLIFYLIWALIQNQSVVHLIYFWMIIGLVDQKRFQMVDI